MKDKAAKVAETAMAVGAAAATTTGSPGAVAVAATLAALPPAVAAIIPHFWDRQERRVRTWWKASTSAGAVDAGDFEAELHKRLLNDDDAVLSTIMASLRALLETLDPSSVVPLGRLTRKYLLAAAQPDRFFRGMADVLARIQAQELAVLRKTLHVAVNTPVMAEGDQRFVKLLYREADGGRIRGAPKGAWLGYQAPGTGSRKQFIAVQQLDQVQAVFSLLKGARLADDFRGGFGESAGPDDLLIERDVARRIVDIVDEPGEESVKSDARPIQPGAIEPDISAEDSELACLRNIAELDPYKSVDMRRLQRYGEPDELQGLVRTLDARQLVKVEWVHGGGFVSLTIDGRYALANSGAHVPSPHRDSEELEHFLARSLGDRSVAEVAKAHSWTLERAHDAAEFLCRRGRARWERSPLNMGHRRVSLLASR